jgi:hypothetical protein
VLKFSMFGFFPIVQGRQAQGFSALSSFIKGVGCVKMSLGHASERAWIFSAESGSGKDAPPRRPPKRGHLADAGRCESLRFFLPDHLKKSTF